MNSGIVELNLKNVSKFYSGFAGVKIHVLDDISFDIKSAESTGKIFSILAPFGSGKSTLLKIISAVENPTNGTVTLNGSEYNRSAGNIVYIPEKPSSFPWLNVKENIDFALRIKKTECDIPALIEKVGLTGYENHFPHQKSLGFRFRISLARAVAVNPAIILLDDPFKNLHKETKKEILRLILNLKQSDNINFLIAATNLTDAIELSDEIFLMKGHPGKIFKNINIDRNLLSSQKKEYLSSLKNSIESSFSVFEGTHLVSEIK